MEETALKVTDIEFVLVQDCIHSPEFYKDAHFVLLNYTCRCAAKKPRVVLNDEGREFRWLTLAGRQKMTAEPPNENPDRSRLNRQRTRARSKRDTRS